MCLLTGSADEKSSLKRPDPAQAETDPSLVLNPALATERLYKNLLLCIFFAICERILSDTLTKRLWDYMGYMHLFEPSML